MKRQSSISSYFTKKPAEKKPRLEGICVNKSRSSQDLEKLHQQFREKLNTMAREKSQKHQDTIIQKQKLTPLEAQVAELKEKHPHCLLLIEVGYKFRFFGEDAKIASRILHIAHFIDRNFYVASIPVHRLNIHVKKLVNAGYRVGIVRQTETAALKAAGSNKSQPFARELDQMITKGTLVDDLLFDTTPTSSGGYLMCLVEEKRGGHASDERVLTGMVAVHPSTGDIIYDAFEDTYMRNELETRLLHIEPVEMLVPTSLSQPTEKLMHYLSLQKSTSFGQESVRIERMPVMDTLCTDYNASLTFVTDFYATTPYLTHIIELPSVVVKALAALVRYLKEFQLSDILKSAKFFSHFVSKSHMLLNGNTLVNLEVYRNNTDFTEKGSLFSVLNHTKTKFGQRLLKKWIGRPLIDISKLNERMNAIEEIISTTNSKKNLLLSTFRQLPDLEKGLCRIHYGKSTPIELVQVLDGFVKVSTAFHHVNNIEFKSRLLNQLFGRLPTVQSIVSEFRSAVQPTKDKVHFFLSEERWPEIPREKNNIKSIEHILQEHLAEQKTATGLEDHLKFVTVAGIDYLFEVSNAKTKSVPQDWIKISGTKTVSRYHDKFIIQKLKEHEQHREMLALCADKAYKSFLVDIAQHYEDLRDVVSCLAQLDCLLSLSITASQTDYVKPTLVQTHEPYIDVIEARHPIIEHLTSNYVSNDIQLGHPHKTLILTGPNMGGKSSYVRQIGLIAMMAQIGSYVPAKSATLGMLDAIYTRMGASDNMMRGESTFMVELNETSDMMRHATSRSLVILDELGRGTSTHDGQAIAYAVLKYFVDLGSLALFVTHYPSLGNMSQEFPDKVKNGFMGFLEEEGQDGISDIVFLYKLVNGIASSSYGMNVAKLANIPVSVIKAAKSKSEQLQKETDQFGLKQKHIDLLQRMMSNKLF